MSQYLTDGSTGDAMDAANILKPLLARGRIRLIGATTPAEYRRYIEGDAALERRFQPVTVDEPSPEETLDILRGLQPSYEKHHEVTFEPEAQPAAVELTVRYVHVACLVRQTPLRIDRAAAQARLQTLTSQEKSAAIVIGRILSCRHHTLENSQIGCIWAPSGVYPVMSGSSPLRLSASLQRSTIRSIM